MTKKELRALGKVELLRMLRDQALEIDRQSQEIKRLEKKLSEKTLSLENAGSIAEASLQVNNLFTAAQESADIYIENIRRMEEICRTNVRAEEEQARKKAAEIIVEAERACSEREAQEKEYIEALWADLQEKLLSFYSTYSELGELIKKINFLPGRPDT